MSLAAKTSSGPSPETSEQNIEPSRMRVAEAPSQGAAAAVAAPAKSGGRRRVILTLVALLVAAGVVAWGYRYWTVGRFMVSTDNAYVGADIAIVAPKVSGYVAVAPLVANSHVNAGDLLVKLDDSDYRVAVDQAKAKVDTQDATIARLGKQVEAQLAAIDQSKAQLQSAEADEARSAADFQRTSKLAINAFASQQSLDSARADRDKTASATVAAQAAVSSARANLEVLKAQKAEAESTRKELVAALAKAQLDLDATQVRAPSAGIIGNKAVEVGDYVTAGKRLAALVPDNGAYVDANFKETQLRDLRPGQRVELSLDTDPDHPITGTVDSIAPAAGQVFSLLPPENATGNFTKIVQRVPVRVRVPLADLERGVLRPGLSVVATVDTRTGPSRTAEAR
ncbi:HlyD family secretion protein [Azorhizobium doebereinerae]|uniref:HlyD family secretion protein n=1 Tax=Azorhizobium doebereinerae TaxID=281091 RepID=UPI00041C68D0|nr:HlyD family secretion protein [Azorhizobium doebereinerae]